MNETAVVGRLCCTSLDGAMTSMGAISIVPFLIQRISSHHEGRDHQMEGCSFLGALFLFSFAMVGREDGVAQDSQAQL